MTAKSYPAWRQQYPRIISRAVLLGLLGVILMFMGTPVAIILPSYAVMFALTLPFLHLSVQRLWWWALIIIALAPPAVQGVRILVNGEPEPGLWLPGISEIASGYYPALAWLAYSLVGLSLVRIPLTATRTLGWVSLVGTFLMLIGYGGGSWLTQSLSPQASPYLFSLVGVEPHTDSGFEILGNIGFCLVVIALSVFGTRSKRLRFVLAPLLAAGRISLTLYVAHLIYIWALGPEAVWEPSSQGPLLWLIGASLIFAQVWFRIFAKGPLEWALDRLSTPSVRHAS